MTITLPERPDENQAGGYEHGAMPVQRTPKSEYDESFLRGLKDRGEVRHVGDNWKQGDSNFPLDVEWVLYPNGDLERLHFTGKPRTEKQ